MVVVNILFRINTANHFCNKDRRRKTEDGRQKTEDRRPKTEDPRLTADAVSRAGKTEDRRSERSRDSATAEQKKVGSSSWPAFATSFVPINRYFGLRPT